MEELQLVANRADTDTCIAPASVIAVVVVPVPVPQVLDIELAVLRLDCPWLRQLGTTVPMPSSSPAAAVADLLLDLVVRR